MIVELLEACRAQHQALDTLFAMLMEERRRRGELFYPSKSGQPWEAVEQGHRAIAAAEACKVLLEIPVLEPRRVRAIMEAAGLGRMFPLLEFDERLPLNAKLVLRITLEPLLPGLTIDSSRMVEWPMRLTAEQREQLARILGLEP